MIAQLSIAYVRTRPWKIWQRLVSYFVEGRPLTTRGRWFNRLLFVSFGVAKRLPQLRDVKRPAFILGTGRNGSTMLGLTLSLHRNIGFLNEAKALWHSVIPEGDVLGNYSSCPARFRFGAEDATPRIIRDARRLLGAYLRLSGATYPLDKCSEFVFRVPFLRAIFPDARFLFLIRNGRDVCASVAAWSENHGKGQGKAIEDWWGRGGRKWRLIVDELVPKEPALAQLRPVIERLDSQVDMAAVEWILTIRGGLRLTEELPGWVLPINYEELIACPEQELSRIFRFWGVPADDVMMSYASRVLKRRSSHQIPDLNPKLSDVFDQTMEMAGY